MKLQKALRRARRTPDYQIAVETTEGLARLNVPDIHYVESLGHYILFHTKDRTVRVRASLKEQEGALRAYHFRRVHKSFLINLMHLENIYPTDVVVAGEKIPLGRVYRDSIVADFMRYMRG